MKIEKVFEEARRLGVAGLEKVAEKYVRSVFFKDLCALGSLAPLSGPVLKSGKKYDIFLADDLENSPDEQLEIFARELIYIWLLEVNGISQRDKHEDEIYLIASQLAEREGYELRVLLEKYLVR